MSRNRIVPFDVLGRQTINLDTAILWQYNFGKFKNGFVATKSLESPYANKFKI